MLNAANAANLSGLNCSTSLRELQSEPTADDSWEESTIFFLVLFFSFEAKEAEPQVSYEKSRKRLLACAQLDVKYCLI